MIPWERRWAARRMKRALDLAGASTALVATSPVFVAICAAELVFHGWPPFFVQVRPGLRGRPFPMLKFRTMTDARGKDGELLPDSERLTAFGRALRRSSLDELPELLNVLRGEMSLVGPRPLLLSYLDRYTPEQMRRHQMPPGITGWAQINGRNALNWPQKFELDLWYVDNWSLSLDLRILIRTVRAVLRAEGISAEGEATMSEFRGESASRESE